MLDSMDPTHDENCNYRKLYEGAQSSLTDMASKHASALGRIGRLRNSVVQACKNTVPAAFAQLESKMGRRLSDSDDQMIVAAVEHLLRESRAEESTDTRTARELRRLLALRGVILSGDNPGDWVKQLGGQPVRTDEGAFLATELSFMSALSRRRERDLDAAADAALPAPAPDAWSQAVERLLGPRRKTEAQISAETAAAAALDEKAILDATPHLEKQQDTKPPRKKSPKAKQSDPAPVAWPETTGHSWDNTPPPSPVEDSASQTDQTGKIAPSDVEVLTQTPSDAQPPVSQPPVSQDRRVAPAQPVRVELFPNPNPPTSRKRTRRQPKTTAIPPESFQDTKVSASPSNTADVLTSIIRSPRPVFTSELAEIAGSEESFESWKREQMTDGSTVRFIAPKARHKQRGALVIPVGTARDEMDSKGPNWWSVVLDKWRGAKLYELGVLLSKVSSSVASCHVDDHLPYVNLTLSRDRGVTGVVVLCDDDVSLSSPGFTALQEGLTDMLTKQAELTIILVTSDKVLDEAVAAAAAIYKENGWAANSPVVVAKSWEWANDTGTVVEVPV